MRSAPSVCDGLNNRIPRLRGRLEALYFGVKTCESTSAAAPECVFLPMALCLPIATWVAFLKDFSRLKPVSLIGIGLVIVSMIMLVVNGLASLKDHSGGKHSITDTTVYPFLDWQHYPLFFGNAAFLFCIHTVAIPIHTSMKNGVEPDEYDSAVNWSITFVAVSNIAFAIACFWIYGDQVEGNVVLNLPQDSLICVVVKILLVLVMIFTFGLFVQPLAELVEEMLLAAEEDTPAEQWRGLPEEAKMDLLEQQVEADYHIQGTPVHSEHAPEDASWTSKMIRVGIILFTFGLGLGIPDFGLVCNLVGSVANTTMGLILPPVFYLKLKSMQPSESLTLGELVLNIGIVVFATVLMVTSATVTIISIVCVHTDGLEICTVPPFDHLPGQDHHASNATVAAAARVRMHGFF